jgi:hypothetical protein
MRIHNGKRWRVMIAVFCTLFVCLSASAATYYVNLAAGNDSNSGLLATSPWRTIQKAANTMRAGDTCLVAPGVYDERVTVTRSGAAGAPITFKGTGEGVATHGFTLDSYTTVGYVIIEGFEISTPRTLSWDVWSTGSGVSLVNTQHCEVRNNYIHNTVREGIMIFGNGAKDGWSSSNNIISGNRIAYAGAYAGITLNGAAQLIENNDISHTIQHPLYPTLSTAAGADADGIKFAGRDHVIRGNHIHSITFADLGNINPHIDAFQTLGPAYNILIERNRIDLSVVSDFYQAAMISQLNPPTRDLTFQYNIIIAYRGLNIWGINDNTGAIVPIYNVRITNNTFYGVDDYDIELHNCPNSIVKNNAMSPTGRYIWTNSSTEISNNSVVDRSWIHPDDFRVSDPGFVNAAAGDFHLKATSPLIDAGINLENVEDFEGVPVPQGSAVDVGALEFPVAAPDPDDDADGLRNSEEATLGTDPANPDTDGDGVSDGNEVTFGTDPLNPYDVLELSLPSAGLWLLVILCAMGAATLLLQRAQKMSV